MAASFDTISHNWLIRFLEHRIRDRRIVRLIRKCLTAGVLEEGRRIETGEGTPQGTVISPFLANDLSYKRFRRGFARDMDAARMAANRAKIMDLSQREMAAQRRADTILMKLGLNESDLRSIGELAILVRAKERLTSREYAQLVRELKFGRIIA